MLLYTAYILHNSNIIHFRIMPSPISIIIPIKNRTIFTVEHKGKSHELRLFEKCLESLFSMCTTDDRWEIVIIDFGSTDVSMKTWISMRNSPFQCTIRLVQGEGTFSKGKGINIGVEHSSYPTLLMLDTDMEIKTRALFEDIETNVVKNGNVFFPICYSYTNPQHTEGFKRDTGTGVYSIQRSMFRPIMENTSWGNEDTENYNFFLKQKKVVRMYYDEDYVHQWHPDSLEFKNKYYNEPSPVKVEPVPLIVPRVITLDPIPMSFKDVLLKKAEEVLMKERGSADAFLTRATNGTRANLFLRRR